MTQITSATLESEHQYPKDWKIPMRGMYQLNLVKHERIYPELPEVFELEAREVPVMMYYLMIH
jgi:hypothetical protein